MFGHGESLSNVTPDKQLIPLNNKMKQDLNTSIKGKVSIQEPDKPSKISKQDSIPDVEKQKTKNSTV